MNEVVYWYSYIDDPRTLVVVELVAIERDQKHGIEVNLLLLLLIRKDEYDSLSQKCNLLGFELWLRMGSS